MPSRQPRPHLARLASAHGGVEEPVHGKFGGERRGPRAFEIHGVDQDGDGERIHRLDHLVGGLLCDVRTLRAVEPPPGLYGVVGTGVLWDVSTLCAVGPPAGLYGVVGTGLLWDISTLCAVIPPPGHAGAVVPTSWTLLSCVEL
jgi:hypothetical protein